MDPSEIIKHAPDLLKGGAAVAGALKLTDVVKAMLGPATAEFAERLRDDVRLYRYGRQLECLKKAEQMATDAGFTPKAVPIKILFPLLEGASLEEDEGVHTMWAALLANASSPHNCKKVRPGFIAILEQLAPDEALLLKGLKQMHNRWVANRSFKEVSEYGDDTGQDLYRSLTDLRSKLKHEGESEELFRERWIAGSSLLEAGGLIENKDDLPHLTSFGVLFLMACEPPKP